MSYCRQQKTPHTDSKINFSLDLKGQSAIEYLMTYGWMLLVVAVVGGAIFSIAQSEAPESTSGFTGQDVQIEEFGVSDNELDLVMRNSANDNVEINSVKLTDDDMYSEWLGSESIGVTDTEVLTLANVSEGDSANDLDVEINYDRGQLTDMTVTGTISGNLEITDTGSVGEAGDEKGEEEAEGDFQVSIDEDNSPVTEGEAFDVDYSVENEGDKQDSQDIVLEVDGEEKDSVEETLGEDESSSDTLSWSTEEGDADEDINYEVSSENSTETGTVTVEELEGPTASISVNESNPEEGESVEFDASDSSEGDGSIESFDWDFDDGNSDTGETVTHSFNEEGEYNVELTVEDENGESNVDSVTVNSEGTEAHVLYDESEMEQIMGDPNRMDEVWYKETDYERYDYPEDYTEDGDQELEFSASEGHLYGFNKHIDTDNRGAPFFRTQNKVNMSDAETLHIDFKAGLDASGGYHTRASFHVYYGVEDLGESPRSADPFEDYGEKVRSNDIDSYSRNLREIDVSDVNEEGWIILEPYAGPWEGSLNNGLNWAEAEVHIYDIWLEE